MSIQSYKPPASYSVQPEQRLLDLTCCSWCCYPPIVVQLDLAPAATGEYATRRLSRPPILLLRRHKPHSWFYYCTRYRWRRLSLLLLLLLRAVRPCKAERFGPNSIIWLIECHSVFIAVFTKFQLSLFIDILLLSDRVVPAPSLPCKGTSTKSLVGSGKGLR